LSPEEESSSPGGSNLELKSIQIPVPAYHIPTNGNGTNGNGTFGSGNGYPGPIDELDGRAQKRHSLDRGKLCDVTTRMLCLSLYLFTNLLFCCCYTTLHLKINCFKLPVNYTSACKAILSVTLRAQRVCFFLVLMSKFA